MKYHAGELSRENTIYIFTCENSMLLLMMMY